MMKSKTPTTQMHPSIPNTNSTLLAVTLYIRSEAGASTSLDSASVELPSILLLSHNTKKDHKTQLFVS